MSSYFEQSIHIPTRCVQINQLQQSLINLCRCLPATSYLSKRLLRAIYGKPLKHMINTGASFRLRPISKTNTWEVWWKNNKITETVPFPKPTNPDEFWMLATGPSVKNLDLSPLRGQNIIGINGAIAICKQHNIQLTHYTSTDPDFFYHRPELIRDALESGAHCFLSFNGMSRICARDPDILKCGKITLLETVNRFYGIPQLNQKDLTKATNSDADFILPDAQTHKIGWSFNPQKGVFASNTIAYSACQLISYLGTKHAYILGMDLGFNAQGEQRAYESGDNARPSKLDESYHISIEPAFKLMASIDINTRFWNLSENSRLPSSIIPKASFHQAIRGELSNTAK